jgi:hypothetical protein
MLCYPVHFPFYLEHTLEYGGAMLKLCFRQIHLFQGLDVHDIEAASAVHESLCEFIAINQGVDDHGVASRRNQTLGGRIGPKLLVFPTTARTGELWDDGV